MATLRELIIKISANSNSFQTEIARASRMGSDYYRTMEGGGRRASAATRETQRALRELNSELLSVKNAAGTMAGAFAGAFASSQLIHYADTWNQLNGRLKLASTSAEDFSVAQRSLMDISQRTGTSIQANSNLYSRIASSLRDAGYASKDIASVTETVATSLKLSGASTEEASSVITQLSQALGSGVLRGEEFNAIMENGGRLAKLLADGLGTTVGGLRNMAANGELTTDKIVPLLTNVEALRKEFSTLPASISGSTQKVQNAFMAWVGGADNAVGASSALSGSLDGLAKNINSVANTAGILVGLGLARYFGNVISNVTRSARAVVANTSAEISLAEAQVRGTQIGVAAARAAVYRAQQARAAATTVDAQAAAERSLAAAQAALNRAIAGRSAAVNNLTGTASLMSRLGGGVLGILGGWPGVILGAGAAMYGLYQHTQQVHQEAIGFANNLDEIKSNLQQMSVLGLKSTAADARTSIDAQKKDLADLNEKIAEVKSNLAGLDKIQQDYNKSPFMTYLNTFYDQADITAKNIELTDKLNKLEFQREQAISKVEATQKILNQASDLATKKAIDQAVAVSTLKGVYESLNKILPGMSGPKTLQYGGPVISLKDASPEQQKALEKAKRDNALAGLSGLDKSHQQHLYEAEDLKLTGALYTQYIYNKDQAAKKDYEAAQAKKENTAATKTQNKSEKEATTIAENFARKMADLSVATEVQKIRATQGEKAAELYAAAHESGAKWTDEQRRSIQSASVEMAKWTQKADDAAQKHREQADALRDLTDAARKYRDETAQTINMAGMSDKQRNRYDEQQQIERVFDKTDKGVEAIAARKQALDELDKQYQAIAETESNWQAGFVSGLKNSIDTSNNLYSQMGSFAQSTYSSMTDYLTTFVTTGKASFRDFTRSVLSDLAKIAIQKTIAGIAGNILGSFGTQALSSTAGNAGSSFSSGAYNNLSFNAKGGVYDSPSLSAYSNQVHSTPKLFAFAKGAGVFGEAGPEAIMPLTRGKDGSLGVRAVGGTPGIGSGGISLGGVVVNVSSRGADGSVNGSDSQGIGKQLQVAIVNTINEQASKQGTPLWRAIKGG